MISSARVKIKELVEQCYKEEHSGPKDPHNVRYAGRVFDEKEMQAGVEAVLDFWLTGGMYTDEFEKEFGRFVNKKYATLVNSGSSANLLALSALTSPLLKRPLKPGDEVITIAAGFPTTVNPIIQLGMIPVFVDVDIRTYNVNVEQLAHMIGPKTRAIMLAHTLGNPFNIKNILQIVYGNSLYLIEDCCDALGSVYDCNHPVGHWSDISTYSFYPAHHITMGEGGCVCTNDALYNKIIRSFRDWGRDCFCNSGINNSCNSRYSHSDSELPNGYDHKYIYSHIGYNLKATEMQAAIGLEQLKKLPEFIKRRKENFNLWQEGFQAFRRFFILPEATENTDPAWFAYPITIKDSRAFTRNMLTIYLENHGIETRNLFGGNLLRQPMYKDVVYSQPENGLPNTDKVMNDTFFLGTYPGLTKEQINYIIVTIQEFITSRGY